MVINTWNTEFLLKSMNKTNITLIPKSDHPHSFKDFRPISLSNVTYKIFSKVLCNRLKPILDKLIAPHQSAFLKGRLISDNIMLASDCLHQIHSSGKRRKKLAALKVDFSKAFDRLSWQFILACLQRMNFPIKWQRLVYQCISTVEYYIQLNGQISFAISPSCGIRQGDPLSPYLYIIASNILSCMIHQSESQGLWKGIKICKEASPITHLLYADDSLFSWKPTQPISCMLNRF